MEPEQHNQKAHIRSQSSVVKDYAVPIAIVIAGSVFAVSNYLAQTSTAGVASAPQNAEVAQLAEGVIPSKGVVLPATWGDLGKKLADAGAIDPDKMIALYEDRGGFPSEYK